MEKNPDLKKRSLTQEVNESLSRLKHAISNNLDSATIDLLRKHYNKAKGELEEFLDKEVKNEQKEASHPKTVQKRTKGKARLPKSN
jgi:hypothetical protein